MTCVANTRFFIKVNGYSYGYIEGKIGIRQGDPMSPLLFILVMEYLSRVLQQIRVLPNFIYHSMCRETKLTYLAFADDLMIFCKAINMIVKRVKEALKHFTNVTGLVDNKDKSSIYIAG